jgi:diadenosine tetraphosphate (Ap4A) HIT family hydrolase
VFHFHMHVLPRYVGDPIQPLTGARRARAIRRDPEAGGEDLIVDRVKALRHESGRPERDSMTPRQPRGGSHG